MGGIYSNHRKAGRNVRCCRSNPSVPSPEPRGNTSTTTKPRPVFKDTHQLMSKAPTSIPNPDPKALPNAKASSAAAVQAPEESGAGAINMPRCSERVNPCNLRYDRPHSRQSYEKLFHPIQFTLPPTQKFTFYFPALKAT